MRSRTGGMGRAGGEGDVHSPSSMKVSATMPSKGARRTVLSSWAWARATAESARSAAARAARQAASAPRASLSTPVEDLGRDEAVRREPRVRSRSRPAALGGEAGLVALGERGLRSRPRRGGAAPAAGRRPRAGGARPCGHALPRRWGSRRTRPPVSGASLARRRALTVPAREFVTVSSTRPFSAATVRTGHGSRGRRR